MCDTVVSALLGAVLPSPKSQAYAVEVVSAEAKLAASPCITGGNSAMAQVGATTLSPVANTLTNSCATVLPTRSLMPPAGSTTS